MLCGCYSQCPPKGTFLSNTTDVTLMLQRHFWSELLCFTADKIHAETVAIDVDVFSTGYRDKETF